jgi:hypothetical protein
VEEYLEEEDI